MLRYKYSYRKSFFTDLLTLSWGTVPGSKTFLKDKTLKSYVAIQPSHHQSQFCLCDSPLVSSLRWTVSHRALFDLGKTSVYAVCFGQLYNHHHHHLIIYVNRIDILMFSLSVSNLFYLVSLKYIRQWNTDYLRYLGHMLFAHEHD